MSCQVSGGVGQQAHNESVHALKYAQSGNGFFAAEAQRLQPFRRTQRQLRGRLGQCMTEHEAVLDALFAGDGDAATKIMRTHVAVHGE